jgi:L-glyceraldehyde 3-phosphate reductase
MFNRWVEPELLGVLESEGIGCIVFSPLAQGLLTDRYLGGIPEDSRAAKPHGFLRPEQVTPEKIEKVSRLHAVAQRRGQTLAQMATTWVLRHPAVTSALIGASKVAQVEQCAAAAAAPPLSPDETAEIDRILGS